MLKRLLAGLAALVALGVMPMSASAVAGPVRTGHLTAELVAATEGARAGGEFQLALRQAIDKGWHTYWRNSGDSGAPTELSWTLPAGWTASEIVWAPPSRKPIGPLMNYGYSGEVLLPVAVRVPASAPAGQTVTLRVKAAFLVCSDICIPEDADLSLDVKVVAGDPAPDATWGPRIQAALDAAPRPGQVQAVLNSGPEGLKVAAAGAAIAGGTARDAYFFPYAAAVIDHAAPQALDRGPEGLTLTLKTAPGATAPATLAGVLAVDGRFYEIEASPGAAPAGASGLGPPPAAKAPQGGAGGLAGAILFAFVGGLILNLMPCVFPVLAMKAASLAGHGHDRAAARAQGLAFLAGVMATFLGLAALLLAVRAGGEAVGWGFQLQSPPVVAGLALLMLAVGLNMSGLFGIGSSLQGIGAGAASQGGGLGAFLTGALAVVVAAPCTAPFMAPALGWAMTQPAALSLAVFAGLGLGFAAPFTLAALAPGVLSRLPRPGPWMDTFRKVLAFPMYGAAAWLAWVLAVQAGPDLLARLLAAGVALSFACWLAGLAQRRSLLGQPARALGVVALGVAVLSVAAAVWPTPAQAVAEGSAPSGTDASGLAYETYTPERLAALRAEGRAVFVNYTAAWCVTCQVNERVAFSTRTAAEAFAVSGTVYLKADWTRRDAVIAEDLARFGRAGVPLYLVYPAGGGDPEVLPQLLTPDMVARAVKAAADG
ncbi:protein-disulfide reductase DsbD [Phenylobacterium sp.]|uniref:protein-disulfide reductase DsbD family protein n=1 Tax=Phenylobacterium sp. TaxID=1871053 RepID=UPI0025D3CF23|nr:protein-disulfide reductase DsbD domain-containing protein [Phenylobacterium sp.]MCA3720048.1 thioredoxin family protein [Phenylobacterium sp.]